MYAYKKPIHTFSRVSTLKIRYQKLEIIDNQACIFADVEYHDLLTNEYNLSVQQIINNLRPSSAPFWISRIQVSNQVLSCFATTFYRDIVRFKALKEQQTEAAASENAVIITQNDLASISTVEDVIKVALRMYPSLIDESNFEYHPTFQYHVVEDAILDVNGWECLRKVENRIIPIEDDEWLMVQKNKLLTSFPWMSLFNPSKGLLEYGLKLLTLTADAKRSREVRQRMLSKALRIRTSMLTNNQADLGHTFCIAILLIGIYQCNSE